MLQKDRQAIMKFIHITL